MVKERRDLDGGDVRDEVLGRFVGEMDCKRRSFFYRAAVVLIAGVMVLLPVLYVAIVVGVGYGIYWHGVSHTGILSGMNGPRMGLVRLFLYGSPLGAGGILLVFMIKPLVARQRVIYDITTLPEELEPLLYEFVATICEQVGAPMPRRIDVTCDINASASFRRGFLSFWGNDLILTIGVPLVGGLKLAEFASILAHEFGHFTQGGGMRATYTVHRINHWFGRVVYERDQLDDMLAEMCESESGLVVLLGLVSQLLVWVTRRVLWILMVIAHLISCLLSRQMEYDADYSACGLTGSGVFSQAMAKVPYLAVAHDVSMQMSADTWEMKKLCRNLVALDRCNVKAMTKEAREKIAENLRSERTGLFDTHPPVIKRIRKAKERNLPGIFHSKLKAGAIFSDFDALAGRMTRSYFEDLLSYQLDADVELEAEQLLEVESYCRLINDACVKSFSSCGMGL